MIRYFLLCLLTAAGAWADIKENRIPDEISLMIALLAVWGLTGKNLSSPEMLLGGICVSLPLLAISLVSEAVLGKTVFGGGDIKLFAALGSNFGPGGILFILAGSCVFGLIYGLAARLRKKERFPFAPGMAVSAVLLVATFFYR